MSSPLLLALSVTPLACYFWLLALWHGGRHPRVISGTTDFVVLALGVGGLLTFGPAGQAVARRLFGEPSLAGWAALASAVALVAAYWGRRSGHRLVIYHIDPEALDRSLQDVLDVRSGHFRRTLAGFEEASGTGGLSVESSRRFHYAVIEARGPRPAALLAELRPALAERLRGIPTGPSPLAWWLLALSALTMLASLAGYLATQPRARETLRVLLEHLRGG
jgi:hypothetical protein